MPRRPLLPGNTPNSRIQRVQSGRRPISGRRPQRTTGERKARREPDDDDRFDSPRSRRSVTNPQLIAIVAGSVGALVLILLFAFSGSRSTSPGNNSRQNESPVVHFVNNSTRDTTNTPAASKVDISGIKAELREVVRQELSQQLRTVEETLRSELRQMLAEDVDEKLEGLERSLSRTLANLVRRVAGQDAKNKKLFRLLVDEIEKLIGETGS